MHSAMFNFTRALGELVFRDSIKEQIVSNQTKLKGLSNISDQSPQQQLDNVIRGTIFYRSFQFLGFADDIDIIGRTTAKVCQAYNGLKREAARIGLRINATKTK